jgi:hypothetical protein
MVNDKNKDLDDLINISWFFINMLL